MKLTWKLGCILVGAHLLLGLTLLSVEAVHGINDQDASFALALLFHGVNFPTVRVLQSMGDEPGIPAVLLAGIVQWTLLAAVIAGGYRFVRKTRSLPGGRG